MPTSAVHKNQSRKDRKNKAWTRRIVFAFFIFIGLIVLLESPLTRIRHVFVRGNALPAATLIKDSGLKNGMSLWQVNAGSVAHRIIAREPLVQHVNVHTNYMSGTVTLSVSQKQEVAVFQQGNQYYSLLDDGTVYQKVQAGAPITVPIVSSSEASINVKPGMVSNIPGIVSLCGQLGQTSSSNLADISQIVLNQYGDAAIYLDNGFVVQTQSDQVSSTLGSVNSVIAYFVKLGYGPGMIDMTGQPPYRYTPFRPSTTTKKGN